VHSTPKLIFSIAEDTAFAEDEMGHVALSYLRSRNCNGSSKGWVPYGRKTIRIWRHDSVPDVICELRNNEGINEYVNMSLSLYPIYQRSICEGGVPFHAALVALAGRGVLLVAPGDVGKSTCCQRLPCYWEALCDDQSLAVFGKQRGYRAHPFPTWGDYLLRRKESTWNVQHSVPLCGVFFLEQSDADEAFQREPEKLLFS
jgi:SynChlorMet cassette protein ScmC